MLTLQIQQTIYLRMMVRNYLRIKLLLKLLVFLMFAVYFIQITWNIGQEPVKVWDESVTAQNAIEMMQTRDYIVIRKNGQPDYFNTRPPLAIWTKVISYQIFGISAFSTRLPSLVASLLLAIFLSVFLFWQYRDPYYIIFTLMIMATTRGFISHHVARTGDPDALLVLFTGIYYVVFFLLIEHYPKNRNKYLLIIGVAITLAFYTKSLAGLSPLAGIGLYMLLRKNGRKLLLEFRFYITAFLVLCSISAYYFLRDFYDPGYIDAIFKVELGIINDPLFVKHPEKLFYFNYLRKTGFFPYFALLPLSIIPIIYSRNALIKRILIYSWIVSGIFLFGNSLVVLKNEWYISPIYVSFWIIAGVSLTEIINLLSSPIQQNSIRNTIKLLFVLILGSLISSRYFYIFRVNTTNPNKDEYFHERAGNFLNSVKQDHADFRNIKIVTSQFPRQIDFYILKYKYLDNSKIERSTRLQSLNAGDTVILCEDDIERKFYSAFKFEVLDSAKYCKLYRVLSVNPDSVSHVKMPIPEE